MRCDPLFRRNSARYGRAGPRLLKGASMALANAEIVNMEVADSLKISCDYTMYGIVNSVLPEFESIIRDTEFTDSVCIYLDVKPSLPKVLRQS